MSLSILYPKYKTHLSLDKPEILSNSRVLNYHDITVRKININQNSSGLH